MKRIVGMVRIIELTVAAIIFLLERFSQIRVNVLKQFSGIVWRLNFNNNLVLFAIMLNGLPEIK